jgi:Na+-translocating ferredoxin:NAD+ oxidoreductase subunit C
VLKTFSKGGVHPTENKITRDVLIKTLPVPKIATVLLTQHLGAPSVPVVAAGDRVYAGQLIAKSEGFISANIHAPVSGTIKKIDKVQDTSGYKKDAIIIETEGDEWISSIDRSSDVKKEITLSKNEIISRIAEAGIVGMGGATFPANVKLSVPNGKKAEYLLINGVECEPYLTCDHRVMLEKAEELIVGIRILMKALEVTKCIIGIENNKEDAISKLAALVSPQEGITVQALKVKYPQGGEKQLIKALINKEVPSGGIPIDIGAVAFNIGTVLAVYEAVQKNKPLIERVVTVTGKAVKNPGNFLVRIGTPVTELIEATGGLPEDTAKIINGGPMMGRAVVNSDIHIVKGCSGILIMPEKESNRELEQPCIRCAKCVSACPMGLEPYKLMSLTQKNMFEQLQADKVTDCIECGSCNYTCPAHRPLLDYIRFGKASVLKLIRSQKK